MPDSKPKIVSLDDDEKVYIVTVGTVQRCECGIENTVYYNDVSDPWKKHFSTDEHYNITQSNSDQ